MIYRGTDFTERINMSPMDRMSSIQWIEMRRFATSHELEVFLCDDYGHTWMCGVGDLISTNL